MAVGIVRCHCSGSLEVVNVVVVEVYCHRCLQGSDTDMNSASVIRVRMTMIFWTFSTKLSRTLLH